MNRRAKTLTSAQYTTFFTTFFLMCVLRVPVTLFLLFGFALVLTFARGKKQYCAHYCPLGTLQDYYPAKRRPADTVPRFIKYLRWPVFLGFWGYLAYVTVAAFPSASTLWQLLLVLMLTSTAAALLLQTLVRRRTWCSRLCPFGKVLDGAVKLRHVRAFEKSPARQP